MYRGELKRFHFQYRDPLDWLLRLLHDETLASFIQWHSVHKTLRTHKGVFPLYDEPETGEGWWEVDVRSSTLEWENLLMQPRRIPCR